MWGVMALVYLLARPASGWLAARCMKWRVIGLGLGALSAGLFLTGAAHNAGVIGLGISLVGLGVAFGRSGPRGGFRGTIQDACVQLVLKVRSKTYRWFKYGSGIHIKMGWATKRGCCLPLQDTRVHLPSNSQKFNALFLFSADLLCKKCRRGGSCVLCCTLCGPSASHQVEHSPHPLYAWRRFPLSVGRPAGVTTPCMPLMADVIELYGSRQYGVATPMLGVCPLPAPAQQE